jgi:hypothetical protein
MPPEDAALYAFQVAWTGGETAYARTFWVWETSMSGALTAAQRRAEALGATRPVIVAGDPADPKELPDTAQPDAEGLIHADDVVHAFPANPLLALPHGVVLSRQGGDYALTEIQPGYQVAWHGDLAEVTAVLTEAALLPGYLELVAALPDIRVFWMEFSEDWEDGGHAIYTNEALTSRRAIEQFVNEHREDTLLSGFVCLTT